MLVHGAWGNPGDWQWVQRPLENRGVHVSVPDLPSHRSASAGLAEDAKEVRAAIQGSPSPVVVVGWSYGGTVIGPAAMGESSVVRLIYVADIRNPQVSRSGTSAGSTTTRTSSFTMTARSFLTNTGG